MQQTQYRRRHAMFEMRYRESHAPAHPVRGPIGALIEEIRFADDSPLEEAVSSELVSEGRIPC
jgi:hypothetical protein